MRKLKLAVLATMMVAGLCLMGGCSSREGSVASGAVTKTPQQSGFRGTAATRRYELPDVSLTDTNAQAYNLRTSPSRPVVLVLFGYTNCPDECAGVLSDLATALGGLAPGVRDDIQVLFVTVDPGRDKPAVLRQYLDRFSPALTGLSGDKATITSAAQQLGMDILPNQARPDGGYEVPHSAQVLGFDRSRQEVVTWTPDTAVTDYRLDFELLVNQQR